MRRTIVLSRGRHVLRIGPNLQPGDRLECKLSSGVAMSEVPRRNVSDDVSYTAGGQAMAEIWLDSDGRHAGSPSTALRSPRVGRVPPRRGHGGMAARGAQ